CQRYTHAIQDTSKAKEIFKLKKESDIHHYQTIALGSKTKKAVQRYTGVAFDHLEYSSLDANAQHYIDDNVVIFSNLFGPIKAGNKIPEYRLAQGSAIEEIELDRYYAPLIKEMLDSEFEDEDILDIRAGYYDRFYIPAKNYTTLKFIKDGKVVSHWAKAYRGLVLREIAKAKAASIDAFMSLEIENLHLEEIQTRKNRTEIIYRIEP
ncbi:MAG: peroxide stress protein YaaA, partial [Sulfurovaceae bacterium]